MKRGHIASGLTVIAVATAAIVVMTSRREPIDPWAQLAASVPAGYRWIEPRLSGGFAWKPLRTAVEWKSAETTDIRFRSAIASVLGQTAADPGVPARHVSGMASLLAGDSRSAIAVLTQAAEKAKDAHVWSDLAAAHYQLAVQGNAPEHFDRALAAVDAALKIERALPEAAFNRAVILQRIGLRDAARAGWQRFLQLDDRSAWAREARMRMESLAPVEPFRAELDRAYRKLTAGNSAEAARLVRTFPQDCRTWGEGEILGRWGEALLAGDESSAGEHLTAARLLGQALVRRSGERLLADAVAAIDSSDASSRQRLAQAHVAYRSGRIAYARQQPADAEPSLRSAERSFRQAGSPMSMVARYFAANTLFDRNRIERAHAELSATRAAAGPDYRALRGQTEWQLALCEIAKARWGSALTLLTSSMAQFDAIGEDLYAANVRNIAADVYHHLGDTQQSRRQRLRALARLGQATNRELQLALAGMTRTAIGERDWTAATSLLEIEVRSAEVVGNHALRADVLLRRALVHLQLRDAAAARQDVRLAQAVEADIGDTALRTRLQADRGFVEAMLASMHPGAGAIEELGRAIEFHRHEGRRMLLPQMLLVRSRARRAGGDVTGAWVDLESAASELEQQRESLPQGDIRAGIFDTAREVFEDAVDMQLARGDAAAALHYAERGRARVLLDAATGDTRDVPRDDDGWKRCVTSATTGLSFVSVHGALHIFIVDRHGVSVARSTSSLEIVLDNAEAFATAVAADDDSAMRRTGRVLYASLIAPVQDRIEGVQHLLISGESNLLVVPFSALVDPRTQRYLIEDFSVVTTPTIAAYGRFSRVAEQRRSTARLLAIGDPRRNDGTPRLAASEDEVRAVERLYSQSVVMTGPNATRGAFVHAAATANVIHFAGHGIGAGLRAKLLFATAPGDDGQMYANELSSVAMPDVSVAVLAACSTGQGRRTAEGVWSIGRSFLQAGVPSVVATLWPLDDQQAPRLFTRFHEHLVRGARSSDALRATQLELLREKGRVRPSLWAALQVIGS